MAEISARTWAVGPFAPQSSGTVNRRPWHDRAYDPLWAECQRLGIPVSFHGGGVLERFPDLRVALLEDNCSWAPWLMHHLDEETAVHYVDWFGDDNIVFSTDFPHGDSQYPHAVETFRKLPLPETTQRKIVGDNWSRLYGIPLERKRP